ncbi:hypothetical protein LCGC14_2970960 [marine sediment metagenome]|uniref:ClpX-type ZB domain-containing protein n=1 Tax=marine sediment metagenome TaxID=412755 RepID=A0A0F8XWW3_9ZZZZ
MAKTSEPEGYCHCGHPAERQFMWAPGHIGGLMCDCCIKRIWDETLRNVTEALANLTVRCPT